LALQAKVDLDLPKFELLLSVSKDCRKQDLSSTTEGIAFELNEKRVARLPRKAVLNRGAFLSIKKLPLRYFSFLV
jgi:hypothetical protein